MIAAATTVITDYCFYSSDRRAKAAGRIGQRSAFDRSRSLFHIQLAARACSALLLLVLLQCPLPLPAAI